MKKYIALFILITSIFTSCGNGKDPNAMSKEDRLKLIRATEEESFGDAAAFDASKAVYLAKIYAMYADENPEDELTPNFLFKAGDICMGLEKSELAISYFDRIIENYPDFDKLPYCLFLKGFIYENQVVDLEKAELAYKEFIELYPDHEMTESANFSLKNLGKSPEELIRQFEENSIEEES